MTVQQRTHYEVLEVLPTASDAVIRSAYRARSKELHPDRGGDPQEMAATNHAYTVLTNPEQRQAYDADLLYAASYEPAPTTRATVDQDGPVYTPDAVFITDPDIAAFGAAYERAAAAQPQRSAEIPDEAIPTLSFWAFLGFGLVLTVLSIAWVAAVVIAAFTGGSGTTSIVLNLALSGAAFVVAVACLWKRITSTSRRANLIYLAIGGVILLWGVSERPALVGWALIAWALSYFITAEAARRIEHRSGWISLLAKGR